MDHVPDLFKPLVNSSLGPLDARLAEVDGVGQERASGMDSLGITAFLQLNAFAFEKLTEVFVKFVFLNRFHKRFAFRWGKIRKPGAGRQLQMCLRIVTESR